MKLRSAPLVSILLFFCVQVLGNDAREATIKVHLNRKTGSGIYLYKLENGQAVSLGFKRPDEQNNCSFSLQPGKGAVYFLRKAGVHSNDFRFLLYVMPGDKKEVQMYSSEASVDFDSVKVKDPSKETVLLQQWNDLMSEVGKQGVNQQQRDGFFAAYKNLEKQANVLKGNANVSPGFKTWFSQKVNTDLLYAKAAGYFYFSERYAETDTNGKNGWFYQELKKLTTCDSTFLTSEHGLQLIHFWLKYTHLSDNGNSDSASHPFNEQAKMICNEKLRAVFVADHMIQLNTFEKFTSEVLPYESIVRYAGYSKAYDAKYSQLHKYAQGEPAYNFSLHDVNDKLYTLADFKGKVVVVDVWAMWCAPCLSEKPFFLDVEKQFDERNDIVFIGISVDGISRTGPWKSFVAKKGYKNIELISDFDKDIMKYYGIQGIPRFMIFDKNGRIVTVDAPRPSQPEFKALIDKTLNSTDHAIKH